MAIPRSVSKEEVLAALAGGAGRLVDLLRSLDPTEGARPVPGLEWNATETAAHVVTVAGRLLGDRRRSARPGETDALNALCLTEFDERDPQKLAGRLEADMKIVVQRVYQKVDFDRQYPFHGGTTISGGGGAAWLLCELLVHGYDVATATGKEWRLEPTEARVALSGPLEYWAGLPALGGGPRLEVRFADPETEPVELPVPAAAAASVGHEPVVGIEPASLLLSVFHRVPAPDARLAPVLSGLGHV